METILILLIVTIIVGIILIILGLYSERSLPGILGIACIIVGLMSYGNVEADRITNNKATHYIYIARNMEDLQVDTIHSKHQIIDQYVWVNMDSLWVNNSDPYATSYIVIRQITE